MCKISIAVEYKLIENPINSILVLRAGVEGISVTL
jgi:hypothetical protein